MNLTRLTQCIPVGEPIMRVTDAKITLNAEAVSLLGITGRDCLDVWYDKDVRDRKRVYIGRSDHGSVRGHMRGNTFQLFSRPMARALKDALEGEGAYRIEEELGATDYFGTKVYSVFFRRCDK